MPITDMFANYGIDGPFQRAAIIAQIGEETGQFEKLRENLHYRKERAAEIWPSKFQTPDEAAQYVVDPEKLANFVFAGRLGNGPPDSGDGYRYRGAACFRSPAAGAIER